MTKNILLLIEDNPLLVEMYREALARSGITVLVATDGKEGIAIAKEHKPAVIILDLMMHGVDGFGVLAALKSDPDMSSVKRIVLTGTTADSAEMRARNLGADDYLIKSEVDIETIVSHVNQFINT